MTALLLRLAGPLQSWGDASRFTRRHTRLEPTKSGVLGLLAAAQGRRRTDPIEDLAALSFGVRTDQRGRMERDLHTAVRRREGKADEPMPLSFRYYLTDAVFVAAVSGDEGLLSGLDEAIRSPRFAPYLGRRSCPPTDEISMGLYSGDVQTSLREAPWQAHHWYRVEQGQRVLLDLVLDAEPGTPYAETARDVPISYDPTMRQYGWRDVFRPEPVPVVNTLGRAEPDFLAAYGGA